MVIYFAIICEFILKFIYRWRHMTLGKLIKKKGHFEKRNVKIGFFFRSWRDYGLKKMPKNLKLTKIDYIMWGIFPFYFIYYFNDFSYFIDNKK